mmetsp:Transcript_84153/g.224988  ORF Transcript_84153/g.224988 Transcript_84153/m.224988 type:complete len:202 (-) Transcript_84153:1843-2448(-)
MGLGAGGNTCPLATFAAAAFVGGSFASSNATSFFHSGGAAPPVVGRTGASRAEVGGRGSRSGLSTRAEDGRGTGSNAVTWAGTLRSGTPRAPQLVCARRKSPVSTECVRRGVVAVASLSFSASGTSMFSVGAGGWQANFFTHMGASKGHAAAGNADWRPRGRSPPGTLQFANGPTPGLRSGLADGKGVVSNPSRSSVASTR